MLWQTEQFNKSTEYNTDLKFLDQENDNPENQIEMIDLDYLHDLGFRGEGSQLQFLMLVLEM